MKKSRFSEEQIIGGIEAARGRGEDGGVVPGTWDQRGNVLPMEVEVRWHGSERGAAAEADGRGEPPSEAAGGGAERHLWHRPQSTA